MIKLDKSGTYLLGYFFNIENIYIAESWNSVLRSKEILCLDLRDEYIKEHRFARIAQIGWFLNMLSLDEFKENLQCLILLKIMIGT